MSELNLERGVSEEELSKTLARLDAISGNVQTIFRDNVQKVTYPFIYVDKMSEQELRDLNNRGVLNSGDYPFFLKEDDSYKLLGRINFSLEVYLSLIRFREKTVCIKDNPKHVVEITSAVLESMMLER